MALYYNTIIKNHGASGYSFQSYYIEVSVWLLIFISVCSACAGDKKIIMVLFVANNFAEFHKDFTSNVACSQRCKPENKIPTHVRSVPTQNQVEDE